MGPEGILHREGRLCLSLLAWAGVGEATPGYSQFPKRGEASSYPQPGYELIPQPVHNKGSLHAWYWLLSAHLPLSLSANRQQSFQELSPALLVRWGWSHSLQQVGKCLRTFPGYGKLALALAKCLFWEPKSGRSATHQAAKFPGQRAPLTWFCRWAKTLVAITT